MVDQTDSAHWGWFWEALRGSKYAYKFWGIVWKRKERKCRRMEVRGKVERMHGNQRKKGGRVCSKLKITEAYITSSGTGVNPA